MRDFCGAAAAPTLTPKRSWRLYVALDSHPARCVRRVARSRRVGLCRFHRSASLRREQRERLQVTMGEGSRSELSQRGGHLPDGLTSKVGLRGCFKAVAVAESGLDALDAERKLMQPGFVGDPQRAHQQPLRAVELPEPRPADPALEQEVDENVRWHALAAGVALLPPPLKPDPVAAEGGTVHQLDQRVADVILCATPAGRLLKGTLRAVCLTHNEEQAA